MSKYPGDAEGWGLRTWVSRSGHVGLGMRVTEGLAVRQAAQVAQQQIPEVVQLRCLDTLCV